MRTSSSDSDVAIGLEIWRQMAVTYAGSAQIRVVALLKHIMTPTEWNHEKAANVLQMYHHWLELISKYESLREGSEHQRQVYNISAQPGDRSASIMPTDQLRGLAEVSRKTKIGVNIWFWRAHAQKKNILEYGG